MKLSHLPAYNSWAQAITQVPCARWTLPPSLASQRKEGGFGSTHSHGGPRDPRPGRHVGVCVPDAGSSSPVFPQEMKEETLVSSRDITLGDLDINRMFSSHVMFWDY